MNIRFEYLYRDAGNFKHWGEVVFSNPHSINISLVTAMVANVLIDQAYFVANKAGVPDLHFSDHDEQLDHGWHEFHRCEPTEDAPNDPQGRSIEAFIGSLREASRI